MPNMNIRHQEVVITDSRVPTTAFRAAMNVYVFPKDVVISDYEEGFFAPELQILRLKADGSERKEMVVLANRRRAFDDDVRIEAAALSNVHPIADPAIRANGHIFSNTDLRAHNGSRMNHGCRPMEESRVASAASSEPT